MKNGFVSIQVDSRELISLGKALNLTNQKLIKNVNVALYESAIAIANTAKRKISREIGRKKIDDKSRNLYKRAKSGLHHKASAPYQYPKSDTGTLVSSIGVNKGYLQAEVGTPLMYGAWLEDGTRKMLPRPWLNPALNENKKYMKNRLLRALEGVFE